MVIKMCALSRMLALSLCLLCSSTAVYAMSEQEIERRFQLLEQENQALRNKLESVESVLKHQGIDPDQPLLETSVRANNDLAAETAQLRSSVSGLKQSVAAEQERIKFGGFLSAGFTRSDEAQDINHRPFGFNGNSDFSSDSVLGLQITFEINDSARAVTQIVANGWNDWDPDIEWAYLAYDYNEQVTMRAGRMRLPFYLYSESMDVGYSYPWVRPPLTMYNTELSNYDGMDIAWHLRTGDASHRLSAFYGSFKFDVSDPDLDATVSGDDVYGVNLTSYWNDWTYRLSYLHLDNSADFRFQTGLVLDANDPNFPPSSIPPSVNGIDVSGVDFIYSDKLTVPLDFYSFATAYDDGQYMAILEIANLDVGKSDLLSDEVLGVLTLGYHLDRWLPYVGYGREYYKQSLDSLIARTPDRDYKTAFAGVRFDITPGISAKFQWDYFYDFKGTPGPFEESESFVNGDSFDQVNIYTFLIDAVF